MGKFGAGVFFSVVPAICAGILTSLFHPAIGMIVFVGVFGFGLNICFGKSGEDRQRG
jgi:hypothetical protein